MVIAIRIGDRIHFYNLANLAHKLIRAHKKGARIDKPITFQKRVLLP